MREKKRPDVHDGSTKKRRKNYTTGNFSISVLINSKTNNVLYQLRFLRFKLIRKTRKSCKKLFPPERYSVVLACRSACHRLSSIGKKRSLLWRRRHHPSPGCRRRFYWRPFVTHPSLILRTDNRALSGERKRQRFNKFPIRIRGNTFTHLSHDTSTSLTTSRLVDVTESQSDNPQESSHKSPQELPQLSEISP